MRAVVLIVFGMWACVVTALPLDKLAVPSGFKIKVYADNVPGARSMALGDKGTVFVGTRGVGKVYALVPNASGDQSRETLTIAQNLDTPNGVAFRDGDLYVAENKRIVRYDNI